MTFTKDQLIERIAEQKKTTISMLEAIPRLLQDSSVSRAMATAEKDLRILEIALAALESLADAEPVAWKYRLVELATGDAGPWKMCLEPMRPGSGVLYKTEAIPLYTRTQPAPVVPQIIHSQGGTTVYADYYAIGWNACRAAMLQGKADPVPGWIPCSERMPETDGNYWGWWSESKRQGPVWFIKSDLQAQFQSSEITHWMPLPAPPFS